MAIYGGRRRRRWRCRRSRASRVTWLDEEVDGNVAELLSWSEKRGGGGGYGDGEQWRRWRSAVHVGERPGEGEE